MSKGVHTFLKGISEHDSVTGVQTCLIQSCSPALKQVYHKDSLTIFRSRHSIVMNH